MITVRPATLTDLPWLLRELQSFDQFFDSSRSLFPDLETAEAIVSEFVTKHLFLVAQGRDGCLGFIAGIVGPHPYNPALTYLSETFWWVTPQFRGSRAGLTLLNAFVMTGKQLQVDAIVMTLESDSPVNPETLTRRGFRPKETNYLLEVVA